MNTGAWNMHTIVYRVESGVAVYHPAHEVLSEKPRTGTITHNKVIGSGIFVSISVLPQDNHADLLIVF